MSDAVPAARARPICRKKSYPTSLDLKRNLVWATAQFRLTISARPRSTDVEESLGPSGSGGFSLFRAARAPAPVTVSTLPAGSHSTEPAGRPTSRILVRIWTVVIGETGGRAGSSWPHV